MMATAQHPAPDLATVPQPPDLTETACERLSETLDIIGELVDYSLGGPWSPAKLREQLVEVKALLDQARVGSSTSASRSAGSSERRPHHAR
jgi:hypothetical protein